MREHLNRNNLKHHEGECQQWSNDVINRYLWCSPTSFEFKKKRTLQLQLSQQKVFLFVRSFESEHDLASFFIMCMKDSLTLL